MYTPELTKVAAINEKQQYSQYDDKLQCFATLLSIINLVSFAQALLDLHEIIKRSCQRHVSGGGGSGKLQIGRSSSYQ